MRHLFFIVLLFSYAHAFENEDRFFNLLKSIQKKILLLSSGSLREVLYYDANVIISNFTEKKYDIEKPICYSVNIGYLEDLMQTLSTEQHSSLRQELDCIIPRVMEARMIMKEALESAYRKNSTKPNRFNQTFYFTCPRRRKLEDRLIRSKKRILPQKPLHQQR